MGFAELHGRDKLSIVAEIGAKIGKNHGKVSSIRLMGLMGEERIYF